MKNEINNSNVTKTIETMLWEICNKIRDTSPLRIEDTQPYILGFMFYRFLSEKIINAANKMLEYKNSTFSKLSKDDEFYNPTKIKLINNIGYFIDYKDTFRSVVDDCTYSPIDLIQRLTEAFKNIEDSTIRLEDGLTGFKGLFNDILLTSNSLGSTTEDQCDTLLGILKSLDMNELSVIDSSNDVLGDIYEFIIGKYALTSAQKAGEFYTPSFVSKLVAKIATHNVKKPEYIYDPTCGSGSLLIKARSELDSFGKLLGQEKSTWTYNMARMNMFLHNIPYRDFNLVNGNTLKDNKFDNLAQKINIIVANPPFSTGWNPQEFNNDKRFNEYPRMAPKSKADFAFVQHMIYMLKDGGKCAVVVPHGLLFRGDSEGEIRKYLVGHKKYLRAVIGLPSNMFYNASIPACILLFEKTTKDEKILFIEASKEFVKNKNKNIMSDENIDKILDVFFNKKEVDKFSKLVSLKEIEDNEYNLNITRYIDTFEEEEEIDINAVNAELKKVNAEIAQVEKEIEEMIKELVEVK